MKKHIFWIAPLVLYIFIVIFDQGANYFNTTWFNVKHVALFGVIIYVLLLSLYIVYRFFIRRFQEKRLLKYSLMIVLSSIAIVGSILISNLQLQYIETYEVPHIKECTYYDHYGNVIYKSYFDTCPELNVSNDDFETLSFSVNEQYEGYLSEPMEVADGIGFRYYEAVVGILTEVEIKYTNKSNIESLSYSIYQTTNKIGDMSTEITGYMYQEKIFNDYQDGELFVATYEIRSLEMNLNNATFPDFNDLEPVIKKYTSSTLENNVDADSNTIVYKEITYDEEENEIENIFAYGTFESINEPLMAVDFYEDGVHSGDMTDYYFDYNEILIKNKQEKRQSYGVDRTYDERTVTFIDTPIEFYSDDIEEEMLMSDTYLFQSFSANLTSLNSSYVYDLDYSVTTINDDIFVDDSKGFYHKFVFTDYGVRVEEYTVRTFDFSDLLPKEEDELDIMIGAYLYESQIGIKNHSVLDVYDFKEMMLTPGTLTNFHFYQHNHLVEYAFYGVHERFD